MIPVGGGVLSIDRDRIVRFVVRAWRGAPRQGVSNLSPALRAQISPPFMPRGPFD